MSGPWERVFPKYARWRRFEFETAKQKQLKTGQKHHLHVKCKSIGVECYCKGSSINDVTDLGKRGVRILWRIYISLCTKKRDGEGLNEYQKIRDVIYGRPRTLSGHPSTSEYSVKSTPGFMSISWFSYFCDSEMFFSVHLLLSYISGIWTSLTRLWWFGFKLELICARANDRAASKYIAHFKVFKSDTKLSFSCLVQIPGTLSISQGTPVYNFFSE